MVGKRGFAFLILGIFLIASFSLSFVNAGLFNFKGKVTGQVTLDDNGWTPWLDRDGPGGKGDYETLTDLINAGRVCENPSAIECRRVSDKLNYSETGEKVVCDTTSGFYCLNKDNNDDGSTYTIGCSDYEVRFNCGGNIEKSYCGDGVLGKGEECDGENLGGLSCTNFGYDSGTLKCKADCLTFDTSGCVMNNESREIQNCFDTDGGLNYSIRGYAKGTITIKDSCVATEEDSTTVLREAYCDDNGVVTYENHECQNGCYEGACLQYVNESSYCHEGECYLKGGDQVHAEISGNSYTFWINFISPSEIKLMVNNDSTNSLSQSQSQVVGNIKISIKDILFSSKDAVPSSVYFEVEKSENHEIEKETSYCDGEKCVLYKGNEISAGGYMFKIQTVAEGYVRFIVNKEGVLNNYDTGFMKENGYLKIDDNMAISVDDISDSEDSNAKVVFSYDYSGSEGCSLNTDCSSGEVCISGICVSSQNGSVVHEQCNSGCYVNETCYPLGYRKSGEYCAEGGEFVVQLEDNAVCDNNFECGTNFCIDGQCLSQGTLQRIIQWFKNLFG